MNNWKLKELAAGLHPKYGHEWADEAKCIGEDTSLFVYSTIRLGPTRSNRHKLQKICDGCPVMIECRYEAVRTSSVGWWGGMDDKQRNAWAAEELFNETSVRTAV